MRKGFDGLYGLVRDQLGQDPLSGHLFLFSNRTRTRLKALVWDGSGLWVCAKRLDVIHDRDSIFSKELDKGVTDLGVRVLRTPVRSPKANSVCERLGGSLRRECLD